MNVETPLKTGLVKATSTSAWRSSKGLPWAGQSLHQMTKTRCRRRWMVTWQKLLRCTSQGGSGFDRQLLHKLRWLFVDTWICTWTRPTLFSVDGDATGRARSALSPILRTAHTDLRLRPQLD